MNEGKMTRIEDALKENILSARSAGTRQLYERCWEQYARRHGAALPADPWQVALWLTEIGLRQAPGTVRTHAAAIAAVHRDAGHASPTEHPGVKKALAGQARLRRHQPQQASGLDTQAFELIAETAICPRITSGGRMENADEAHDRGIKDVAMIGLMRDALLRRGECAALMWSDFSVEQDGTGRIIIRASKTDQIGRGCIRYVSTMMVEYLLIYKTVTQGTPEASMFGLSARQICRRIASACAQAGLQGNYSGHSPRIGMAIDLARAGVSLPALMEAGRWKSADMPAHYVRAVEAGSGAVAKWYENDE